MSLENFGVENVKDVLKMGTRISGTSGSGKPGHKIPDHPGIFRVDPDEKLWMFSLKIIPRPKRCRMTPTQLFCRIYWHNYFLYFTNYFQLTKKKFFVRFLLYFCFIFGLQDQFSKRKVIELSIITKFNNINKKLRNIPPKLSAKL